MSEHEATITVGFRAMRLDRRDGRLFAVVTLHDRANEYAVPLEGAGGPLDGVDLADGCVRVTVGGEVIPGHPGSFNPYDGGTPPEGAEVEDGWAMLGPCVLKDSDLSADEWEAAAEAIITAWENSRE